MKKYLLFIGCVILTTTLFAQTADEKAVAAAVESLRVVMIDPNKSTLEGIVGDNLSYGHSSGKMEDKTAFVQSLVSKTSDFVTMDLTQQTIKIVGNTALVRHNLNGETVDSGKPGTARLGVLLVWQKQQGKWKLLARQAFKLL